MMDIINILSNQHTYIITYRWKQMTITALKNRKCHMAFR